ncbi:MAG: FAD:protein FMN transferase [Lachnospiraceae bacterium]|nr:FAD:protein FMN transferase [Lachnospiraceae bacterium]
MKKKWMGLLLVCLLACTGCSGQVSGQENTSEMTVQAEESQEEQEEKEAVSATRDVFAMDTYMTLTAYGVNAEEAVAQAEERIGQLDAMLSTGNAESEVSILNRDGSGNLSPDAFYLLEQSLDIYQRTGGVFNPAIYPLMEAWGFPTKEFKVPERETIEQCLSKLDVGQIVCDSSTGHVDFETEGMKIDFGGIAKGYTSSQIIDIFKENGIESGIINLGGNVQTLGTKEDGSLWRVAIQNPDENMDYLGVLETSDRAVITSGGYERYFEEDGVIYHHILDPATGYPAENGLTSVTIVSDNGLLADGLSTSLFVMGLEKAETFWRDNSGEFDAILLTEDNELYVTEGIAESFSTSYDMHIIER